MVEALQLRDTRPARSHVAALAGRLKGALVRIGVAPSTFLEGKSRVLYIWFCVLYNGVTLHAIKLLVRPTERIF